VSVFYKKSFRDSLVWHTICYICHLGNGNRAVLNGDLSMNRVKSFFNSDPFEMVLTHQDPLEWIFGPLTRPAAQRQTIDVSEYEDHYEVSVDVPGFTKDELNISVKTGLLTITGKKETNDSKRKGRSEFSRHVTLGDGVDSENISASHKDGVLTVNIPKASPDIKKIEIE
jgi:HSP20 family protein